MTTIKRKPLSITIKFTALLVGIMMATTIATPKANAAYDAGRIIDDSVFLHAKSMTISEIQSFLTARGSGLQNMSFNLMCYGADSQERQWYTTAGAKCDTQLPAADIIYYAAQIYGINPKVILATMQKEQSLVTAPNPTAWQLNQAMGYACPTSGSCNSSSNFSYQIDSGTWALRYHFERARGNLNWWKPSSSWVCGTEKNLYRPNLYPGQNVRFYDTAGTLYTTIFIHSAATSSMYCYTPHAYNNPQGLYGLPQHGTTGLYYSGSYHFVRFFELWFGNTRLPSAFKTSSSPTVYMYVSGYRLVVNQMAVMQDFGISPESIQTVPQAVLNSIPPPPDGSGLSSSINYIVKTPSDTDEDGGSIYYIARGKKYRIQSMDQFFQFGLKESSIRYVPMEFIKAIPGSETLSNFITSPTGNVFSVKNAHKRVFFEYDTYIRANPSDKVTPVSYYAADAIPSGVPIVDKPTLVKKQNSERVHLLLNNSYYEIPTYDTYRCWGFENVLRTPVHRVTQNNHIAPFTPAEALSCAVSDGTNIYILGGANKYKIPTSIGWAPENPTRLDSLSSKIPERSTPLRPYVKSWSSSAVWHLNNGKKELIPTYRDFTLLGLTEGSLDYIEQSLLKTVPSSGVKLGNGQVVKSGSSPAVYVISGNKRFLHSYQSFTAYGNSWSHLREYNQATLDTAYPLAGKVSSTFYDSRTDKVYLMGPHTCYELNTKQLSEYGISKAALAAEQPYSYNAFPQHAPDKCSSAASQFMKSQHSPLVYWVNGTAKHPITSWSKLIQMAGTSNPNVIILNDDLISAMPTGPDI